MHLILAVASAAFYGAADFLGGLTSRFADTLAIVIVSQFAGLVLLALVLPFLPPAVVSRADMLWGAAAGLTGGIGVAVLYHALAVGRMAVVAPVTAVCAAIIPVCAGVLLGERPSLLTVIGFAIAIVAIVLLSQSTGTDPADASQSSGLVLALAAGIAIGLFFLCLARTGRDAGLWPVLTARFVSVPFFGAIAITRRRSIAMPWRVVCIATLGGGLDMLANVLYLIATRRGPLSIVATLSSLYPASTVILARVVLGERFSPSQVVGIACALAAVVLIVGTT